MPDREHRVREIAHRLWEEEGRPSDQDKRHWANAEQIVDAQERTDAGSKPAATGKRAPTRRAGKRTTAGSHAGATTAH